MSELISTHVCKSKDVGVHGNLFGGTMLSWLDEAGAAFSAQVCGTPRMVTKCISEVVFHKPVRPGQIIKILETKIRPAVARDGGDIKFKEFKDGIVRVELQGACSGCPSAALTLKQGVQNLLCHYIPEVREVEAV